MHESLFGHPLDRREQELYEAYGYGEDREERTITCACGEEIHGLEDAIEHDATCDRARESTRDFVGEDDYCEDDGPEEDWCEGDAEEEDYCEGDDDGWDCD